MCYNLQKVNSVSVHGVQYSMVPCGSCEDCRKSIQSAWAWRIAAEIDTLVYQRKKANLKPWKVGFITLTYNPRSLPRMLVSSGLDYGPNAIPCFDRSHARKLIDRIRKHFWKKYGIANDTRLVYLLASEYGSLKARPHYHALFCFPPQIPAEEFYNFIRDEWTGKLDISRKGKAKFTQNKGFVCPREFNGYQKGKVFENPFLATNSFKAAFYAAKYLCKDLDFNKACTRYNVDENRFDYKDKRSFHLVSRSLGLRFLENLTDERKLEILKQGVQFFGADKFLSAPLYIRNKILFDTYYENRQVGFEVYGYDSNQDNVYGEPVYKRYVRREASEFFIKNAEEIFSRKVDFYIKLLEQVSQPDYWASFCPKDCDERMKFAYRDMCNFLNENVYSYRQLATFYVAYFGVPRERCYYARPFESWFARYIVCPADIVDESWRILGFQDYEWQSSFWRSLLLAIGFKPNPFSSQSYEQHKLKEKYGLA